MKRVALGLTLVLFACRESPPQDDSKGPTVPKRPPVDPDPPAVQAPLPFRSPLSEKELPTTAANIALGNLDGEVAAAREMIAKTPSNYHGHLLLSSLLLLHGAVHGTLAEYDEALAHADTAIKLAPREADAWVGQSAVHSRFHLFDKALDDLAHAEKLGWSGRDLEQSRASLLQAQGHLKEAGVVREKWLGQQRTIDTLRALATVRADEGRIDEAEQLFIEAQHHYPGLSPFVVSALWLQEATMWQNAGRPARARELLAAAHERIPEDVAVAAHLATALAQVGERDQAIALLRPIVASSDDPEHAGALADLLGATPEADALRVKAGKRYDELVKAHPDAFADHAARFWLAAGHAPAKAVPLAERNFTLRKTAESYGLYVEALLAAGDKAKACAIAGDAVKALPLVNQLHALAWKAYTACGDTARASEELHATKAL